MENINWFNFIVGGSWGKFISTLFIVVLILFSIWAYHHDTEFCQELARHPESICNKNLTTYSNYTAPEINWSEINSIKRDDGETSIQAASYD
jgi:hypothetical protein